MEVAHAADENSWQEVNLVAMGDWAASSKSQAAVAESLAAYVQGSVRPFDAALTAGDNFYAQLRSVTDPQWNQYFEKMYDLRG